MSQSLDSTTILLGIEQNVDAISSKFDLEKIKTAVAKAEQKMKVREEGEHIVIFWGFSGAGKSSAILTLSGEEMVGYIHPQTGKRILMSANINNQQDAIRIESDPRAGTIMPAAVELKRIPNISNQQIVKLWDMPGFGDNRGITITLINSYYIHRIFALHKDVKLVFTISYEDIDFTGKSARLKPVLKSLMATLGQFKQYQNSMIVMVTKCENTLTQLMVRNCLKKQREQNFQDSPQIRDFMDKIVNGTIPVVVIKMPKIDEESTDSNKKSVTYQYQANIQDFYQKIVSRSSAVFPKLNRPALTNEDILQCKKTAEETQKEINGLFNRISRCTVNYVNEKSRTIHLMRSIRQTEEELKKLKSINQFVNNIIVISTLKQGEKKEQLLEKHKCLKKQFQKNHVQINSNGACEMLERLYNLFIFTYFLSTFQLHNKQKNLQWLQGNYITQKFFQGMKQTQNEIYSILDETERRLMDEISASIIRYSQLHISELQNETMYRIWTENFMSVPSYTLRLHKYASNTKQLKQYFTEIRNVTSNTLLKKGHLDYVLELITLNEKYMKNRINNDLIPSRILPMMKDKSAQIIKRATDYQKWEKKIVEQDHIKVGNDSDRGLIASMKNQISTLEQSKKDVEDQLATARQKIRNHEENIGACCRCGLFRCC